MVFLLFSPTKSYEKSTSVVHTRFLYLLINQAQGLDVGMAMDHVDSYHGLSI